ncbi:MAG: MoxR family ATPase, partial [Moorea sp. SIO2I5]|nr:MoxR family ATPase [Moorena sp. SIO2I5]
LGTEPQITKQAQELIEQFMEKRNKGDLATDQLLNAIYLMTRESAPTGQEKEQLIEQLLKYLTSSEDG